MKLPITLILVNKLRNWKTELTATFYHKFTITTSLATDTKVAIATADNQTNKFVPSTGNAENSSLLQQNLAELINKHTSIFT